MSGALVNVRRRTLFSAGQFTRGALMDRETTRWDPLSRKAGYWLTAKVRSAWRRDNSIKLTLKNSVRRPANVERHSSFS